MHPRTVLKEKNSSMFNVFPNVGETICHLFQHCVETAVPLDFVEGCLALMPHLVDDPLLAVAYWYPRAVLQLMATNACWWTVSMGVVLLALRCRTAQ